MMESPEIDPYQGPGTDAAPVTEMAALEELVRAWEKLRLLYNGIMILPGLGVLALWVTLANLPIPAAIIFGVLVGAGANAAFFLGPLTELCLRGYFLRGRSIGRGRWLIFTAGLVVSGTVFLLASVVPIFWPHN